MPGSYLFCAASGYGASLAAILSQYCIASAIAGGHSASGVGGSDGNRENRRPARSASCSACIAVHIAMATGNGSRHTGPRGCGVRAVRGGADALLSLFPPERRRPLRQAARGERFGFWAGEAGSAPAEAGDQPDYALSRRDAFIDGTGSAVVHYSHVLPARAPPL